MARSDLHRLGSVPVVDLQHDLPEHLPTRVVAPLLPPEQAGKPVRDLNPGFDIDGVPHILATISSPPCRGGSSAPPSARWMQGMTSSCGPSTSCC